MEVKINNKIFVATSNESGKLIIPLNDDFDKLFFKKWENKYKKDYAVNSVEDVDFVKVTERGTLKNCFPILSQNEDFVELVYDLYVVVK